MSPLARRSDTATWTLVHTERTVLDDDLSALTDAQWKTSTTLALIMAMTDRVTFFEDSTATGSPRFETDP